MLQKLFSSLFSSRNHRVLRKSWKIVHTINLLESEISSLSDQDLRQKTIEFRAKLQEGVTLAQLLPEVFAVVREAAKRTLQMRHFDEQLIGGIELHKGNIAEMQLNATN